MHEKAPFHNGDFTLTRDKPSPATPYRYDDGATIIVTSEDLGIGGDFLSPPKRPDMPREA